MVQKYCPEGPKKFGCEIYSEIRSAHFHGGAFPGGEYEQIKIGSFIGPKDFNRINYRFAIYAVIHSILIRWLLKEDTSKNN